MNKTIEIIIGTTGEIQIDAVGFKGPDCEKATAFLEEALGFVGQQTKKPEYHQRSRTRSQPGEDWWLNSQPPISAIPSRNGLMILHDHEARRAPGSLVNVN
jgi:hypothetical protein